MPDLPFHPAANIFPLMTEADFDGLVDDIRRHGLREPVALLDGQILDGRNRYRACLLAGVECQTVPVAPDDPVAYVLSLNQHRRHLTPAQLAVVAAKAKDVYQAAAKERIRTGGRQGAEITNRHKSGVSHPCDTPPQSTKQGPAVDQAAAAVGVSGRAVTYADKVLKKGTPELVAALESGHIGVRPAAAIADLPPDAQREALATRSEPQPDPAPIPSRATTYAHEAIDVLKRIPKKDPKRPRAFQIVRDWMKHNP
jgi:hypothetical protein